MDTEQLLNVLVKFIGYVVSDWYVGDTQILIFL